MGRPTCKTCPYWKNYDDVGDCHRRGPLQPSREFLEWDEMTGTATSPFMGLWLTTEANDFCGEHPDFPAYIEALKTHDGGA